MPLPLRLPELPEFPKTEVYFHGLEAAEFNRILQEIYTLHFEPTLVGSAVFDLLMKPALYAEVRAFRQPEVKNDICAADAAAKLKDFLDVEIFSIAGGKPNMGFWPKGASGTGTKLND